jgi:hypothetical protein
MKISQAVKEIKQHGALLVYPIQNQKDPLSLWGQFFPKSTMKWEWDDSGDNRVAHLWHLREELSSSNKVVYSKWYRGRATFFSKEVFVALLAFLGTTRGLSRGSLTLLRTLEEESPLSTKQLKKKCKLQGRAMEGAYHQALKPLWVRGLIVGYGEVDEGAFPSLAVGATPLLFEELWLEAQALNSDQGKVILEKKLKKNPLVLKEVLKQGEILKKELLSALKKKGLIRGTDLYLE